MAIVQARVAEPSKAGKRGTSVVAEALPHLNLLRGDLHRPLHVTLLHDVGEHADTRRESSGSTLWMLIRPGKSDSCHSIGRDRAERSEVCASFIEANAVGSSPVARVPVLHVVVFPVANRADCKRSRGCLIESQEPTAWAREALRHHGPTCLSQ